MPRMAFVVRPEYEGVGGTVVYGSDGETLDISEELAEGSEIITDNPRIIEALKGFHGADGPVFDMQEITPEGERVDQEEPSVTPPAPRRNKRKTVPSQPPVEAEVIQPSFVGQQPAEHGGSGSGYEGLPMNELAQILRDRGVQFQETDSEQRLIELLEQSEEEVKKEASSGS